MDYPTTTNMGGGEEAGGEREKTHTKAKMGRISLRIFWLGVSSLLIIVPRMKTLSFQIELRRRRSQAYGEGKGRRDGMQEERGEGKGSRRIGKGGGE